MESMVETTRSSWGFPLHFGLPPFCDVDLKLRRQPVVQSCALQDLPVAGHVGVQTRGHDTGRSRRKEQLLAKLQTQGS